MKPQADWQGIVEPGFGAVADAFAANFADLDEIGAGCAVYVGGRCVVDVVGGRRAPTDDAVYDADTLQLIFSSTKGAAAVCAHLLAQRGQVDLHAPVAEYWPDFAAAGKESTTVAMLLSHRSGLPVIDQTLSLDEILAWTPIVEALAAQPPLWEPGTDHGYHAVTYGWLVGEVVSRVTGMSIGEFFAREVAEPLGLDFWIGLPDAEQHRVSNLVASRPKLEDFEPSKLSPELNAVIGQVVDAFLDPTSLTNRALMMNGTFMGSSGSLVWNEPQVRGAQIPGANGVANARSLAKMYAACVGEVDGVRLLDLDTVKRATQIYSEGPDRILIAPTKFGLGFMLDGSYSPLLGPDSFGHPGAGGSLGFADPECEVGFGYVMNHMRVNLAADPRSERLVKALRTCLA